MKSTKERPRSLSLNTRFMISDPVRALVRAGKADALVTFLALQTIVRECGYCAAVDDTTISTITSMTGYDAARIHADIRAIVAAGFFDAELYATEQVLSSRRLQSAYRRRKDAQSIPGHLQLCGSKAAVAKKKTQEPEVSEAPEAANKPEASEAPEAANKPEAPGAPEAANKPEASEAPGEEPRLSRAERRRIKRARQRRARREKHHLASGHPGYTAPPPQISCKN